MEAIKEIASLLVSFDPLAYVEHFVRFRSEITSHMKLA